MFLLLGAGFLIGVFSLSSEIFGGCFTLCKRKRSKSASTIESNPRFHERQTPRDWQTTQFLRRHSNHTVAQIHQNTDNERASNNSSLSNAIATNSTTHHEERETDMSAEVDRIFENVFGEKFNHVDLDNESITTE